MSTTYVGSTPSRAERGVARSARILRHRADRLPLCWPMHRVRCGRGSHARRRGKTTYVIKNLWVDEKPMAMVGAILSASVTVAE